jgi:hypothetical protein
MRSASLLLGGMVLVGVGIALIAGDVPGRWVAGPLLVLAGLACKVVGLMSDTPDEGARAGARRAQRLGGEEVERPRPGIPVGRAPLRSVRPVAGARAPLPDASPQRRAS